MKSFLSVIITLAIIITLVGTTALLWYGSSTTEILPGEDFQPTAEAVTEGEVS